MVYPSTYNEMFVWIGIDQFRQYFDLTDDQLESLYESMRTKKSLSVVGKPDGTILNQLTNGTVEEIKTNSHVPDIMEAVAVTLKLIIMTEGQSGSAEVITPKQMMSTPV